MVFENWPGVSFHICNQEWRIMPQPKVKEKVLDAVRSLPEDATVEDVMERLYFLAKVEEGLRQIDAGQTVDSEEARRRILG
jgi:predicted transcriptional regulator